MKILVLSDNHGHYSLVQSIIEQFRSQVDLILHCGDSEFKWEDPIWQAVDYKVRGNMDFDPSFPLEEKIDSSIGRFLLTHGHLHGVNHGLEDLVRLANKEGANIVFHGHTHRLTAEKAEGVLVINPGSLAQPRGLVSQRTFALVLVDQELIQVDFYDEQSNRLTELTQYFNLYGAE